MQSVEVMTKTSKSQIPAKSSHKTRKPHQASMPFVKEIKTPAIVNGKILPVRITLTLAGDGALKFRAFQSKLKKDTGIEISDASIATSLITKSLV